MSSLLRAFDDDSGLSPAAPMVKDAPSERELEVLRLMSEGLDNAQIAERLFISVNTVKSHALHLMNKLDASNRMHLVARAPAAPAFLTETRRRSRSKAVQPTPLIIRG